VLPNTGVTSFDLVRAAAATHSVNKRPAAHTIAHHQRLHIPADKGEVLPGNYVLLALNPSRLTGRECLGKVQN
jgi:hypothetical protein